MNQILVFKCSLCDIVRIDKVLCPQISKFVTLKVEIRSLRRSLDKRLTSIFARECQPMLAICGRKEVNSLCNLYVYRIVQGRFCQVVSIENRLVAILLSQTLE